MGKAEWDPWAILGIPAGSDTASINRAYRKLARTLHPDINPAFDAAQRLDEASRAREQALNWTPPPTPRATKYPKGSRRHPHRSTNLYTSNFTPPPAPTRPPGVEVALLYIATTPPRDGGHEIPLPTSIRCQQCRATGAAPGSAIKYCATCDGRGLNEPQNHCHDCGGTGQFIVTPCKACQGTGRQPSRQRTQVSCGSHYPIHHVATGTLTYVTCRHATTNPKN